jgi:four helix bundle protein
MRDYKKYDVWKNAHELVLLIYCDVIKDMPNSERFDLTSQMKRAAYSIPLNIAEGCGRNTDKDFAHFLDMALGSTQELEYTLQLCFDLQFISNEAFNNTLKVVGHVKAQLINLIKSLR